MRRLGLAALSLTVLASAAAAGPREEAIAVVERWAAAFDASDVDAIMDLYAPDATFLGTGSTSVVTERQDIRQYFERALLNNRPRGARLHAYDVQVLADGAAVLTGLDTTSSTRDGKVVETPGRVTFVVVQRGGSWLIVHFHRSALPG